MKHVALVLMGLLTLSCGRDNGGGNGDGGNGDGGSGDGGGCIGLQCQQTDPAECVKMGGVPTTLTGKVFAPNGTLPLYNAIVYVPNAPLSPFTEGVSCDACGAVQSGSPVVATVTDTTGAFKLTNVPAGANIPLVIQVGRWRRQITIPSVTACEERALTDPEITRLPKNKAEGDIPKMAIATGDADPFECLLLKIGIDPAEFTEPNGDGRVHYWAANGIPMSKNTPDPNDAQDGLWTSADKLKKYDVVMLPCEGGPTLNNKDTNDPLKNVVSYVNAGGRIFVTHYSYVWLTGKTGNSGTAAFVPFPGIATYNLNAPNPPQSDFFGTIDTSFPKGQAFRDWLSNVDALETMGLGSGKLSIVEGRHDVDTVIDPPAKRWIHATHNNKEIVQHFTFNTPLTGAQLDPDGNPIQCGRVVFSDFHVSAKAQTDEDTFPASCKKEELSKQERALAFMLFDLSACVQDDDEPVSPPIP